MEQEGGSEQAIQSLFRAAHTLKGSSAAMGFQDMQQLTHEMEHLLDKVRSKQIKVTDSLINQLFKSLDLLKQLKEIVVDGTGNEVEISLVIAELRTLSPILRRRLCGMCRNNCNVPQRCATATTAVR